MMFSSRAVYSRSIEYQSKYCTTALVVPFFGNVNGGGGGGGGGGRWVADVE